MKKEKVQKSLMLIPLTLLSVQIINVYQKKGFPESRITPTLGQPFKCFLRLFYLVAILHAYNDLMDIKGYFLLLVA
ncbi:hypothetical protein [Peribacillus simplex]|uniref:hypothetical protein n=1 Tax=Peribacillus simplex TaxID=1478 RepID=UPI00366E4352